MNDWARPPGGRGGDTDVRRRKRRHRSERDAKSPRGLLPFLATAEWWRRVQRFGRGGGGVTRGERQRNQVPTGTESVICCGSASEVTRRADGRKLLVSETRQASAATRRGGRQIKTDKSQEGFPGRKCLLPSPSESLCAFVLYHTKYITYTQALTRSGKCENLSEHNFRTEPIPRSDLLGNIGHSPAATLSP